MLKTLVDLFLLISTDKKSITINDISIFYLFITKKLSEIENHRPGLIFSSLNNSKNNNEDIISNNEEINKNIKLKNIQNELLSLFIDMIDFLYDEKIIILSNDKRNSLNNKINKNLSFQNNSLENELIQKNKKDEFRHYIIELIKNNNLNNKNISFTCSINNFVKFFNSKNKDKNRYIAVKLINIVNPIIKIYNSDNKTKFHKKNYKSKAKCLSNRIPVINNIKNNIFKEKTFNKNNLKNIRTKKYYHKINHSFNNKKKDIYNLNDMFSKNNENSIYNKKKILPKEKKKEENNLTHDTIPGQTLNNCISFNKFHKNNILIESYINYLNNYNKNSNQNIDISDINFEQNKNEIIINEIKNIFPNSQIDNFTKKYHKKRNISILYNNDLLEINENNNKNDKNENNNEEQKFINKEKRKKRNSSITSAESKKEDIINEKYIQCIIF